MRWKIASSPRKRAASTLRQAQIDLLLGAADLLIRIANTPEADLGRWTGDRKPEVDACLSALARILDAGGERRAPRPAPGGFACRQRDPATVDRPMRVTEASDRVLRVTAENLNRLLGLAGESLVESRWVKPFAQSLLRLKRLQQDSSKALDGLRETLSAQPVSEQAETALAGAQRTILECQELLADRLARSRCSIAARPTSRTGCTKRRSACRMRPFADGVQGFPRMVRDVARSLGKEVRLEIVGETTQVDRDILARLDAPLGHLLRNAIDHGLESPDERRAAGKPVEGVAAARSPSQRGRAARHRLRRRPRRRSGQPARGRRRAEADRCARAPPR